MAGAAGHGPGPARAGPWYALCSRSPRDTQHAGEVLGESLRPGDVVTLDGPLGSGKTVFVKGLARGLGAAEEAVTSPTFIYVREVRGGRLPLFHVDAYRCQVAGPGQGLDWLGLDEYLEGGGVVAVEWPEPVGHHLPAERFEVELRLPPSGSARAEKRVIRFRGLGGWPTEAAEGVARRLGAALASPGGDCGVEGRREDPGH